MPDPEVELRALTRADVPAWFALLAAAEEVDRTGIHYGEADLVEDLQDPLLVDPARDLVGAFTPAGELVGYFAVHPRIANEERYKVAGEGTVRPDRRGEGIGTLLVSSMVDRAREVHQEAGHRVPLWLHVAGPTSNEVQAELLAAHGLVAKRWNLTMRVRLGGVPAPPPLPDGYRLVSHEPDLDEALFEAHNAAFQDHPDFVGWNREMWNHWVSGHSSFRPGLTFLVLPEEEPGIVVAYLQTSEFEADREATGRREAYVGKLGCRPEHRGRGLASFLLRRGLHAYQEAGYDEASLDVDSENPTGALGIYRRAGFEEDLRSALYLGIFV